MENKKTLWDNIAEYGLIQGSTKTLADTLVEPASANDKNNPNGLANIKSIEDNFVESQAAFRCLDNRQLKIKKNQ